MYVLGDYLLEVQRRAVRSDAPPSHTHTHGHAVRVCVFCWLWGCAWCVSGCGWVGAREPKKKKKKKKKNAGSLFFFFLPESVSDPLSKQA